MANQSTEDEIKKEIRNMVERQKPILDYLTNFPIKSSNNEGVVYVLNVKFEGQSWQKLDDDNIKVLFEKIGFRVEVIQENTFEKIQKRLEIIRKSDELKNARMFIMFLLSWGGNHFVEDINLKKMDIDDVFVKPFLPTNCSALVNKPKLFFISVPRNDPNNEETTMKHLQESTDVFKFFSTLDGQPSFKNDRSGDHFLRCLLLTILNFYHKKSLNSIVQIVTSIQSSISLSYEDVKDLRQIPVVESIISKKIFFSLSQESLVIVPTMKPSTSKVDVKKKIEELISSDEAYFNFDINYNIESPNKEGDDFYPCDSKPRGVVYVWNMRFEEKRNERFGSEVDEKNIKDLFLKMGFLVEVIKEETQKKIEIKLKRVQKSENLQKTDMFIMFLMSHGGNNHLKDIDGLEMNIKEVFVKPFNSDNCLALENKPKLFFIQACRGDKTCFDNGNETPLNKALLQPFTHPDTDNSIFFSATENYKSVRNTKTGSLFIRCLLPTIAYLCHRKPFYFMVKCVTSLMSLHSIEYRDKNIKQVPSFETTLTKDVYLYPCNDKKN